MNYSTKQPSDRRVILGIAATVLAYTLGMWLWPAARTGSVHHDDAAAEIADASHDDQGDQGDHGEPANHDAHGVPPLWAVAPFVALLMAIALFPLIPVTEHWWESNTNRFLAAVVCAVVTVTYYQQTGGWTQARNVLWHAMALEYVPFIVLLFSLYTISGGVRIEGDLVATSRTNCAFLIVGGLLASFVGTTGAAMLLIRPLIDTNNERKFNQHTIVFFIFVVCNCGGCLLPIGDPPLFLGYLKGVDFLWTMYNLFVPWLVTCAALVLVYYLIDHYWYYPKEPELALRLDEARATSLRVSGMLPNALLLLGVVLTVALLDPTKKLVGTHWYPWPFLREIVQLGLVSLSLWFGSQRIRSANRFNYHAILEVAALFIGIFICMQPALEILHEKGSALGLRTPLAMFWATGLLSAVLDNAPTYVVFYETAASDARFTGLAFHELVSQTGDVAAVARQLLIGISLGSVFLGAMTYIGNGPNFMVRAIAEQSGIRMPSFFGYVVRYAIPILIPMFLLISWFFL